jgi:hypothetical protein
MEDLVSHIPPEAFSEGLLNKDDPKLLSISINYAVERAHFIIEDNRQGRWLPSSENFFPPQIGEIIREYQEKFFHMRLGIGRTRVQKFNSLVSEFKMKIIDYRFKNLNPSLGGIYDMLLKGEKQFQELSSEEASAIRMHIFDAAKIHRDVSIMVELSEKFRDEQLDEGLKALAQEIFGNCQNYLEFCRAKISLSAFEKGWLNREDKKVIQFCANYVKDQAPFCVRASSYEILEHERAWPHQQYHIFMHPLIPKSMWEIMKKHCGITFPREEEIKAFKEGIDAC